MIAILIAVAIGPAAADAHGGTTQPVASNYIAKLGHAPAGLDAKVVDGDLRLWLRTPASATVIVLDYRGAPYLRFTRAGVEVNHNSAMYYLNQTPVAGIPPANLSRTTRPAWAKVTSSPEYNWHDGRLHALATVALSPGTSYVGSWSVPIEVDGRRATISGAVWHAGRPSIIWFWPIIVMSLCALAVARIGRPALNARLARILGSVALVALAVAGTGHELHGHPFVSLIQYVELGVILAFVAWGLTHLLLRQPGYFAYFVISLAALWEGLNLVSVLRDGFVLIDLPAFIARAATLLCLACGAATLVLATWLVELPGKTD